jgi:hypothetical protein
MKKKKLPEIQIEELFLVKIGNDWTRTYMAKIRRDFDSYGKPIICGEVDVEGWKVWSIGSTEEEIGDNLDSICYYVLEGDLHSHSEQTMLLCGTPYFLN